MLFQYYLNTSIVFIKILNEVKTNINLVYEQKKKKNNKFVFHFCSIYLFSCYLL